MNVFDEIKKLNFPTKQYVVFGGAAIAARGIRETHDVDILVTPELLEKCEKDNSWKIHPRLDPSEPAGLDNGTIELYPTIGGGFKTDFFALRNNAEIINTIPFCNLNDVLRIKKAYGREKDLRDVELIEKYLAFDKMKASKFRPELAKLIIEGKKTTTWRLFDDKDFQTGDDLQLINSETKKPFAKATITETKEKPLKDLDDADWEGHERFASDEEMYRKYQEYYPGREISPGTIVKIIHFKLL